MKITYTGLKQSLIPIVTFIFGGLSGYFLMQSGVVTFSINEGNIIGTVSNYESEKRITVDLGGAVSNPGVYVLDEGSRVVDLLSMGGGIANQASKKWASRYLNLSVVLEDSQKVYIPFEWEFPSTPDVYIVDEYTDPVSIELKSIKESTSTDMSKKEDTHDADISNKVNMNSADKKTIIDLPGIGEAYYEKIVQNRPYKDINDFTENSKLPKSVIDKISSQIFF